MMESPHDYDDYGPRCGSILPFFGAIPLPPPSLAWGLLQTSTTSPGWISPPGTHSSRAPGVCQSLRPCGKWRCPPWKNGSVDGFSMVCRWLLYGLCLVFRWFWLFYGFCMLCVWFFVWCLYAFLLNDRDVVWVFVDTWECSDVDVKIFNEKRMRHNSHNLLRDVLI